MNFRKLEIPKTAKRYFDPAKAEAAIQKALGQNMTHAGENPIYHYAIVPVGIKFAPVFFPTRDQLSDAAYLARQGFMTFRA